MTKITTVDDFLGELETILVELKDSHPSWCSMNAVYDELDLGAEVHAEIQAKVPSVPRKWLTKEGKQALDDLNSRELETLRKNLRIEAFRLCQQNRVSPEEMNAAFRRLGIPEIGIKEVYRGTFRVNACFLSDKHLTPEQRWDLEKEMRGVISSFLTSHDLEVTGSASTTTTLDPNPSTIVVDDEGEVS